MTSPAARLYAALHKVACDNDSVRTRAGLAHGDYTSVATLALEDERIFQRSWVCLGHEADIGESGDYAVEAILGHEVLLIRGDDGAVRAFPQCVPTPRPRGRDGLRQRPPPHVPVPRLDLLVRRLTVPCAPHRGRRRVR